MEALKEYAGVVTAAVTVIAALGALGLWAINAQVTPEINRLEARIDLHETLLRQIDRKLDAGAKAADERFSRFERAMNDRFDRFEREIGARFESVDARFESIDARFESIDNRFESIDARFERIDSEIKTIRNDIKTILLRLPNKVEAG